MSTKDEKTKDPSSTTDAELSQKPKNVSTTLWERFQNVSKRTEEVTKRSTAKRIQQLQKSALDSVNDEFKTDEEKEILKKHVELDLSKAKQESSPIKPPVFVLPKPETCHVKSSVEDKFTEINKYMGVNDHLYKADCTRQYARSGLEKQMDKAVAQGDINAAEKLSDQLASRNYGVKISDAFQAKEYLKRKKEEEETVKAKKKKKLAWGFEHKHKWETKSNM